MKAQRIALALAAALVAAGCTKDPGPFLAVHGPLAYVRYIAAVPDTFAMDWRPIDAVENSPPAVGLVFRSFTPYQAMGTGPRHLRLFPAPVADARDPAVVSQIVIDTTITFDANKYYTVIHIGFSRTGSTPADRLMVMEDQVPTTIGTQVAVRVVNLATGVGAVDVFAQTDSTSALSGAPAFANVAYGAASAYVLFAPGERWFRTTAPGTTTPELARAGGMRAPPGAAGSPNDLLTPVGGSTMAGSAFTAYVFPRSVSGSTAPQTTGATNNFSTPWVIYIVDKHPPQ